MLAGARVVRPAARCQSDAVLLLWGHRERRLSTCFLELPDLVLHDYRRPDIRCVPYSMAAASPLVVASGASQTGCKAVTVTQPSASSAASVSGSSCGSVPVI